MKKYMVISKNKKGKIGNALKKRGVQIALSIVLSVAAAALAVIIIALLPEKKNVLSDIGKISTAKINLNDTVYSYYEDGSSSLLTPYKDNGAGSGMTAEVIVPYAECTGAGKESNKSDPLCSPLVRGTVDKVVSVVGDAENPIYCLESGVKVNDEYLKISESGYLLPDNTLTVSSCEKNRNGIQFKLDTAWVVPVQVTLSPQEYHKGYLEREFNIDEFTAEYMDIFFFRTKSLGGELDFSESDIISGYKWIQNENGGTLRLSLKSSGKFFGYSYSLDKNGRFVFTVKKDITSDGKPTVVLDPGHGGSDPGADSISGVYESALNLEIAERTAAILADNGVKVYMTRREDVDVSLDERIAICRKYSPSLFVSVHCDSSESEALYGTHSFYYKSYSEPLADSINSRMAAVYEELYSGNAEKASECDRGIKFYPFAVTRVEECPSALVECGYLSNSDDCAFLSSDSGKEKIATAIAGGILEQLNVL